MLQTTQYTIIFPSVPVDRGISFANLGSIVYAKRRNPRNKSDVYTGVSIPVGNIATRRAFEDNSGCLVGSSASAADLACIRRIDRDNSSVILPCHLSKCNFELMVGHSLYFSVSSSIQSAVLQSSQIFKSNTGIILLGKVKDLMGNLVASGLDKLGFFTIKSTKFPSCFSISFVGKAEELTSSERDITLSVPDISTEIQLFENLPFSINDAQCNKSSTSTVYTNDSSIVLSDGEFFFDTDQDSPDRTISFELECGEFPSLSQELLEPMPGSILSNGKSEPSFQCSYNHERILVSGRDNIPRTGDIEGDACISDGIDMVFMPDGKNILEQVYDKLRLKSSHLFDMTVFKSMKVVSRQRYIWSNNIPISQRFKTVVRAFKPFLFKFFKRFGLGMGQRQKIQYDGFYNLHKQLCYLLSSRLYNGFEEKCQNVNLTRFQFLPRMNSWVSLEEVI